MDKPARATTYPIRPSECRLCRRESLHTQRQHDLRLEQSKHRRRRTRCPGCGSLQWKYAKTRWVTHELTDGSVCPQGRVQKDSLLTDAAGDRVWADLVIFITEGVNGQSAPTLVPAFPPTRSVVLDSEVSQIEGRRLGQLAYMRNRRAGRLLWRWMKYDL